LDSEEGRMGRRDALSPRVTCLDLARGLAILIMIIQHAVIVYAYNGGEDTLLGQSVLLCGTAPAAPVFMLLMGTFFVRSRRSDLKSGILRGLKIFVLGYILNLCRFSLPLLIAGRLEEGPRDTSSWLSLVLAVDILQMAGMSLIVMSFLRRYVRYRWIWPTLAAGISLVSPMLWGSMEHVPGTGVLWGTGENVFFPLFPWLMYPLVGMWASPWIVDESRSNKRQIAGCGLGLLGLGLAMSVLPSTRVFVTGDYYRSGINIHLILLGLVAIWLAVLRCVVERIPGNAVFKLLSFWSRNVTVIYFIQWVFIGWGVFVMGYRGQSDITAASAGLVMVILSDLATRLWVCCRRKYRLLAKTVSVR